MTMKRTELEKRKGLKLDNALRANLPPDRFAAGAVLDKRERRKLDAARGLVPFAVKIELTLANEAREAAAAAGLSLDDAVAALLRRGLAAGPLEAPAADAAE
ncbi:hypothetical protein [Derxia gummosa]|uniref:Uncharacterized protein n=1 Tax=Derxia gummosa DSM 723 TaxID=1121388 RepID=A0A8B6XA36_9BURK|nr:hypothetical protein [Derxia gummosa]